MAYLDLATWIDDVQTELTRRMSHSAAGPYDGDTQVAVEYTRSGKTTRASAVPRIEWDEEPADKFERPLRGRNGGIGTWTFTQEVRVIAATMADCRALAVNLIQAMLQISNPPEIVTPIPGTEKEHDVQEHGRCAKKLRLIIGVSFTVPEEPMALQTWDPTGPTEEVAVEGFVSTVDEDTWQQPPPT